MAMMIKFRAWDNRYKEYIENVLVDGHGKVYFDDGVATQDDLDISVEQFTGLKDAYDKDIYEGDILHFGSMWFIEDEYEPREEEHTGFVEYIPEYASYVVNCDDGVYTLKELTSFDGYSIQGNVHENPELLEEKQ
jgi:uncharacterized phage protein (TIGR01671 family)